MLNRASELLRKNQEKIIKFWETRAKTEVTAALHQNSLVLQESLPEYLNQLVEALSTSIKRTELRKSFDLKESVRVAKRHGHARAGDTRYTMDQMIYEYHILRQVIFDVMEEEVQFTDIEREIIICSIEQAVNDAATQYNDTLRELQTEARLKQEGLAKILATEQRKLELIFEMAPAGIALLRGPTFIFEKFNSKWTELVSEREYLGKTYNEVYPELLNTLALQQVKTVFETGNTFIADEMKIRVTTQSGVFEDRYYSFSYTRILNTEGNPYGIFCNASDVTERILTRKKLEEISNRLVIANVKLNEEQVLREKFVATLSHDLRTPLTSAKLTAQFLATKTVNPPELIKFAHRIITSMDRADRMIRDLLDVSQITAGETLPLNLEACDLNELVQATVDDLSMGHGDRFVVNEMDQINGFLDCNGIRRVIENLANNAVKYGDEKCPITVTLEKKDELVEIAVHNKGNPIPPDELKFIFEPYKRSDSAIMGTQRGWGIGLSLVRGLVEAHGGKASVSSSANEGTVFTIRFPVDSRDKRNVPLKLNINYGQGEDRLKISK